MISEHGNIKIKNVPGGACPQTPLGSEGSMPTHSLSLGVSSAPYPKYLLTPLLQSATFNILTVNIKLMAAKRREVKANAEFVACVVGLSRGSNEPFSTHSGVGKSCLCYRFVYPGFDDYVDDHQSILALHEFESSAINWDHFLYWGSVFKHFPIKGSKSSSHAIIQVHVIEQTVFYQDETSQPFPNCGNYRKRIDMLAPSSHLGNCLTRVVMT